MCDCKLDEPRALSWARRELFGGKEPPPRLEVSAQVYFDTAMKTKRGTNTGGPTYDGLGDDLHPGANLLEILDYVISKEDEVPLPELLDFAQSRAKSVTRETLMNTRRSCKAFPRTIRPPGARPGYLQAVYPLRRRPDLAMSFLNTALDSHWGKNADGESYGLHQGQSELG